jgi:phosphopantothenoylcysteine synthetase/decarboxylase
MKLQHRHFVIGITGGIAAYKTCELIRRLQDEGATVQVVMTESGTRFVSQLTFQALSGRPVYCSAWETPSQSGPANAMPHIDLSRECDAILVAPASADFIARIANGQANDLLTTLCLAREVPLFVAPAMNRQMWQNAATQRNIEQLRNDSNTLESQLTERLNNSSNRFVKIVHLNIHAIEYGYGCISGTGFSIQSFGGQSRYGSELFINAHHLIQAGNQ